MKGGFCAIGECMVEISAADATSCRLGFAGDTFNTAWYVKALLPEAYGVSYFTAFGDDTLSDRQRRFFETNGIDSQRCPIIKGRQPGIYAIALDADGERTFTYWRSESAARCLASDVAALRQQLQRHTHIYFSGITLAILDVQGRRALLHELATAKDVNRTLIFDPNFRPKLWENIEAARETIAQAECVSDIVLTTFDDEALLHGHVEPRESVDRLLRQGNKEFVIKRGEHPAILCRGGEGVDVPAVGDVDVVDTTGAGDSFNGAYIAARMVRKSPLEAVCSAHRTAAAVVQVHGALLPMAKIEDNALG